MKEKRVSTVKLLNLFRKSLDLATADAPDITLSCILQRTVAVVAQVQLVKLIKHLNLSCWEGEYRVQGTYRERQLGGGGG